MITPSNNAQVGIVSVQYNIYIMKIKIDNIMAMINSPYP